MNKVTVICEVEHVITAGVCALCERDRERARLAGVQIALEGSGPPAAPRDWAYSAVQDSALEMRANWAQASNDRARLAARCKRLEEALNNLTNSLRNLSNGSRWDLTDSPISYRVNVEELCEHARAELKGD